MGRRTVSNLSRELKVSRPRIYRAIERLGIEKKAGGEYPLNEWEALKKELATTADVNREKREDVKIIEQAHNPQVEAERGEGLQDVEASTLRARLAMAKQEYDYNRKMIVAFQQEADDHIQKTGRTTAITHNGIYALIPAIANLEKYVKLNIALSKLISDLESDLDLEDDADGDPFG